MSKLDDLILLGMFEDHYEVYGHKFHMTSLTAQESLEALTASALATQGIDDMVARMHSLRIETLARSIKDIDGIPFTSLDQAKGHIMKWQSVLINGVYDKYNDMVKAQEEELKKVPNLSKTLIGEQDGKSSGQ